MSKANEKRLAGSRTSLKPGSALSRYGRHDKACPLRGGPNLPGDERCTCGFSAALATPDPLLKRGLEAADGALVLANCYFERDGRDGYNNDNYCRLLDWIKDARMAVGATPNNQALRSSPTADVECKETNE